MNIYICGRMEGSVEGSVESVETMGREAGQVPRARDVQPAGEQDDSSDCGSRWERSWKV